MTPQTSHPREGYVVLAGKPWLARMIDKARLSSQGLLEALDLDYPCPMDQRLLREFGMDGQTFQAIVVSCQTDEGIIEALQAKQCL